MYATAALATAAGEGGCERTARAVLPPDEGSRLREPRDGVRAREFVWAPGTLSSRSSRLEAATKSSLATFCSTRSRTSRGDSGLMLQMGMGLNMAGWKWEGGRGRGRGMIEKLIAGHPARELVALGAIFVLVAACTCSARCRWMRSRISPILK